jgi:hypothetical protein
VCTSASSGGWDVNSLAAPAAAAEDGDLVLQKQQREATAVTVFAADSAGGVWQLGIGGCTLFRRAWPCAIRLGVTAIYGVRKQQHPSGDEQASSWGLPVYPGRTCGCVSLTVTTQPLPKLSSPPHTPRLPPHTYTCRRLPKKSEQPLSVAYCCCCCCCCLLECCVRANGMCMVVSG